MYIQTTITHLVSCKNDFILWILVKAEIMSSNDFQQYNEAQRQSWDSLAAGRQKWWYTFSVTISDPLEATIGLGEVRTATSNP